MRSIINSRLRWGHLIFEAAYTVFELVEPGKGIPFEHSHTSQKPGFHAIQIILRRQWLHIFFSSQWLYRNRNGCLKIGLGDEAFEIRLGGKVRQQPF